MERKGFDIPDFIYDTFDIALLEAGAENDYYTIDEIKALVSKRIKELNKLGYNISAEQIVEYVIQDTTAITAGLKSVSENKYKFVIAKLAARRKNDKYLNTIIYHELCHMLQLEFLFNNDILYYADGKLKTDDLERAARMLLDNTAHTDLWYIYANKINKALLVNLPIEKELTDKYVSDIFLESMFSRKGIELDFDGFEDDFGYLIEKGN